MKRYLFILIAVKAYSQCPTATPGATATTCKYQGGWYELTGSLKPTINNKTGATFTWTSPPTSTVMGEFTATLTTNAPGVYTLTVSNYTNASCNDVTTHTVTGCPAGTNLVGIDDIQADQIAPIYFDLIGNRVEFQPYTILIEQRGERRRKVCLSEPPR